MKIKFLCTHKSAEDYFHSAVQLYTKKISGFVQFDFETIKPKPADRAQAAEKKEKESDAILTRIDNRDWVVLFDEKGKQLDSIAFSKQIVANFDAGRSPLVFVIGGAYGASEKLKERANQKVKLSDMTMNHLVATTMGLEQIYRALTIWKNIPYHNV